MEVDIVSMFVAVISVIFLALVLAAMFVADLAGAAMGVGVVGGLFWLAYRSDRKDRRKR
jgi:hypothetical protein